MGRKPAPRLRIFARGATRRAEQALRDQPRSADAAQALALSSALVGDLEKAKEAIRRLLEIAPNRRISTALISKNLSPKAKARFIDILREAGMPD
jgi:tetratricopeptide (TPR) repeat protein